MVNLVSVIDGEPRTSSDLVGREFGIAHNEILKKLKGFTGEISPVRFNEMYHESSRVVRGREFKTYSMNRDGYMFLVMNISTKKAHEKKLSFIDAFNQLEKALLAEYKNKNDIDWIKCRTQSKQARFAQTDVIKEFVEYATSQGSKNAKFYYKHITNATYSALQLIQHKKPKLRDTLNAMELSQLMVAENKAKQLLKKYMNEGEHYKAIFSMIKNDLEELGRNILI